MLYFVFMYRRHEKKRKGLYQTAVTDATKAVKKISMKKRHKSWIFENRKFDYKIL